MMTPEQKCAGFHLPKCVTCPTENPAERLIPAKVPKQERRFLQESEYQALLAQGQRPRDRAMIEVLLQTGLRLSELAALTTADIQLPKRITKDLENVGLVTVICIRRIFTTN